MTNTRYSNKESRKYSVKDFLKTSGKGLVKLTLEGVMIVGLVALPVRAYPDGMDNMTETETLEQEKTMPLGGDPRISTKIPVEKDYTGKQGIINENRERKLKRVEERRKRLENIAVDASPLEQIYEEVVTIEPDRYQEPIIYGKASTCDEARKMDPNQEIIYEKPASWLQGKCSRPETYADQVECCNNMHGYNIGPGGQGTNASGFTGGGRPGGGSTFAGGRIGGTGGSGTTVSGGRRGRPGGK